MLSEMSSMNCNCQFKRIYVDSVDSKKIGKGFGFDKDKSINTDLTDHEVKEVKK